MVLGAPNLITATAGLVSCDIAVKKSFDPFWVSWRVAAVRTKGEVENERCRVLASS